MICKSKLMKRNLTKRLNIDITIKNKVKETKMNKKRIKKLK